MSTSLYWSIVPEPPEERSLYNLKRVMAKKFGSYDGSVGEDLGTVGKELIPFLEGIAASGDEEMGKDAQALIDAIEKHGKVNLSIHS